MTSSQAWSSWQYDQTKGDHFCYSYQYKQYFYSKTGFWSPPPISGSTALVPFSTAQVPTGTASASNSTALIKRDNSQSDDDPDDDDPDDDDPDDDEQNNKGLSVPSKIFWNATLNGLPNISPTDAAAAYDRYFEIKDGSKYRKIKGRLSSDEVGNYIQYDLAKKWGFITANSKPNQCKLRWSVPETTKTWVSDFIFSQKLEAKVIIGAQDMQKIGLFNLGVPVKMTDSFQYLGQFGNVHVVSAMEYIMASYTPNWFSESKHLSSMGKC
jgi:hypothetical protein